MKIRITKPANADLEEIRNYIRVDNPAASVRTALRILEAIEYLSTHPTMGRIGRVLNTRELVISGTPFLVVYQIREQVIFILRILHTTRKWPK